MADTACVVDIGTNSVKFVLAAFNNGEVSILRDLGVVTGMGVDTLKTGIISRESAERTAVQIEEVFARHPEIKAARKRAVATEALRVARNRDEVLAKLGKVLGTRIEIIDARKEAGYCVAAVRRFHGLGGGLIVDLGGGSLEIADWNGANVCSRSFQLGILFMYDKHVRNDPPAVAELKRVSEDARRLIESCSFERQDVIAIGATAKIIAGMSSSRRDMGNGLVGVDVSELDGIYDIVMRLGSAELSRRYSVEQARARLLPVGVEIYRVLTSAAGSTSFCVSGYGLRHGVLIEEFAGQGAS